MKNIKLMFVLIAAVLTFAACSDDEWSNDNAEMENIYYFGFHEWGKLNNRVTYSLAPGDTIAIPVEFFSEQNKGYNVEVSYFTSSTLTLGTDYQIVDENGNEIQPAADGSWKLTWPNAHKGIQYVRLKAISGGKTGSVTVLTCNPANPEISVDSTTIAKTADYEVRGFSQNHKVTVNIK